MWGGAGEEVVERVKKALSPDSTEQVKAIAKSYKDWTQRVEYSL